MVSMLIACEKDRESQEIKAQVREYAGICTDEVWEYHLCPEHAEPDLYLKNLTSIDLACLDLAVRDGISLARRVRRENRHAFLILIADVWMSPMSYLRPDILAESLLLRPWNKDSLREVVQEAIQEFSGRFLHPSQREVFAVESRDGRWVLDYGQILYFEARQKKVFVNTAGREIAFYDTLDSLKERLPPQFLRCHRSYLVNEEKISQIQLARNRIILEGGSEIPISRSYKETVREVGYGRNI